MSKNLKKAFPSYASEGMSLREYFSTQAMQGLLSNPEYMKEYKGEKYIMPTESVVKLSIKMADALISELEKENHP